MHDSVVKQFAIGAHLRGWRVLEDGSVLKPNGRKQPLHVGTSHYLRFTVNIGDARKCVWVHKLAAYQKYGDQAFESGVEVRHRDNNKHNNRLDNILIGTRSQNMMDRPKEQRIALAQYAADGNRCLTDEEARSLLSDRAGGMTYKELSKKYLISKSSISYIVHGRFYRRAQEGAS